MKHLTSFTSVQYPTIVLLRTPVVRTFHPAAHRHVIPPHIFPGRPAPQASIHTSLPIPSKFRPPTTFPQPRSHSKRNKGSLWIDSQFRRRISSTHFFPLHPPYAHHTNRAQSAQKEQSSYHSTNNRTGLGSLPSPSCPCPIPTSRRRGSLRRRRGQSLHAHPGRRKKVCRRTNGDGIDDIIRDDCYSGYICSRLCGFNIRIRGRRVAGRCAVIVVY